MRYRLEYLFFERNVLVVHIDKKFSDVQESFEEGEGFGVGHPPLVRDLLGIDGVQGVAFTLYSVALSKGEVFEWEEIIPAVLYHLNLYFDPENGVEEVAAPLGMAASRGMTQVLAQTTSTGERWFY